MPPPFEQFFGRRDQLWFENGGIGARRGTFNATAHAGGRRIPVVGTVIAREGVAFVSPSRIPEPQLQLTFKLRARPIEARVRVHRSEPLQSKNTIVHRYYCTFTAIAADDWDAVVRYVDNLPESKEFEVHAEVDEDFRLLPSATQTEIVAQLVQTKRLTPPKPGQAPLIRVRSRPRRELGPGRSSVDVVVTSRIVLDGRMQSYETRFRVHSAGKIELLE